MLEVLDDYVDVHESVRAMAYALCLDCHPISCVLLASKFIGIQYDVPLLSFFQKFELYKKYTRSDICTIEKDDLKKIQYNLCKYYTMSLSLTL